MVAVAAVCIGALVAASFGIWTGLGVVGMFALTVARFWFLDSKVR
jgi:hypothetical protein